MTEVLSLKRPVVEMTVIEKWCVVNKLPAITILLLLSFSRSLQAKLHRCLREFETSNCNALEEVWAFDSKKQKCVEMVYGGCGRPFKDSNRFDTKSECILVCKHLMDKPVLAVKAGANSGIETNHNTAKPDTKNGQKKGPRKIHHPVTSAPTEPSSSLKHKLTGNRAVSSTFNGHPPSYKRSIDRALGYGSPRPDDWNSQSAWIQKMAVLQQQNAVPNGGMPQPSNGYWAVPSSYVPPQRAFNAGLLPMHWILGTEYLPPFSTAHRNFMHNGYLYPANNGAYASYNPLRTLYRTGY